MTGLLGALSFMQGQKLSGQPVNFLQYYNPALRNQYQQEFYSNNQNTQQGNNMQIGNNNLMQALAMLQNMRFK